MRPRYNIQQTAGNRHFVTGQYNMDCGLRTTDRGLGIKYGLGMKRGLENMDWV